MKRPIIVWFLFFCLFFLGLGGLSGGSSMLIDPSGRSLGVAEALPLLPVPDFFLPGLFLLFVMGFLPLFLIYALWARLRWAWVEKIFRWSRYHWAWNLTLALGLTLGAWLTWQGILIGFREPVQWITAINGLLIVLTGLSRPVREYFSASL